jgi:hypothetical protein
MASWGSLAPTLENAANHSLAEQPWLGIPVALARKALQGAAPMAVSGATLPRDVYAGRVDPNSDEAIRRATDLATTMPLAAMPLSMAMPEGSGSLVQLRGEGI